MTYYITIPKLLRSNRKTRYLVLRDLTDKDSADIARALSTNTSVKMCCIDYNKALTEKGYTNLASIFELNKTIWIFRISNSNLDFNKVFPIASSIRNHTTAIQILSFCDNPQIGVDGLIVILDILLEDKNPIRCLDISGTLDKNGPANREQSRLLGEKFASVLRHNTSVRILHFAGNGCDDTFMVLFAQGF
jgi:hypothetical protein